MVNENLILELKDVKIKRIKVNEIGDFRGVWFLLEDGNSFTIGSSYDTDSVTVCGSPTGGKPFTGNAAAVTDVIVGFIKGLLG